MVKENNLKPSSGKINVTKITDTSADTQDVVKKESVYMFADRTFISINDQERHNYRDVLVELEWMSRN